MDVTFARLFKSIDRSTVARDPLDQRSLHEAGSARETGERLARTDCSPQLV